jgi:hypothetical protein
MRNVSDKGCRENQNTHFMFSNFFPKIVPFMKKCGKIRRDRRATDDNITRRMRFVFWMTKATNTHSEYVILIFFNVLLTCISVQFL